jgi:DNA invertase Pin-like site-specific DNA recombinase
MPALRMDMVPAFGGGSEGVSAPEVQIAVLESSKEERSMSTKRVALYARVSTKGMGQDPEGQLISLREYVQRRGWTITAEYVDNGYSGAKANTRPALQQLWKDARQRKFDVVAVWKLDRFGRSLRDLVNSLDEFRSLGIEFASLTEAIDFGSSLGAVMFALIG